MFYDVIYDLSHSNLTKSRRSPNVGFQSILLTPNWGSIHRGVCHTKILDFRTPLYPEIATQYTKYRFHFTIYWLTLYVTRMYLWHFHLLIYIYRFQWKQYTKILTMWINIQNTDFGHQNTIFFSDIQNTNFWGYRALLNSVHRFSSRDILTL